MSWQARLARAEAAVLPQPAPEVPRLMPVELAERAGLAPDAWQRQVLESTAPRLLLNVTRQGGKSSVAAVLAVHEAVYRPDSLVLCLSPSLRQSGELFRKCLDTHRAVVDTAPVEAASALRLELANGSRIVSLPGTEGTVRGYSAVRLLLVDEASRVADALYHAVRPMLAVSGGRLLALSTPAGCRGWWWECWDHGAGWQRVEVRADQCPRIPRAFLEEERRSLPERVYRQEYECSFEDTEGSVFNSLDIDQALDPSVLPLFPRSA